MIENASKSDKEPFSFRRTKQAIAPAIPSVERAGEYRIFPAHQLAPNTLNCGFAALAEQLAAFRQIRIDGFEGVLWDILREGLQKAFTDNNISVDWVDVSQAYKPVANIEELVKPFLGGDDPLFGKRFQGDLLEFFDRDRLFSLQPDPDIQLTIAYGCGSALLDWNGPLVYVDLPKNELQYRSRAGNVCNLGMKINSSPKVQYKRFYFVDWQVLNRHKSSLVNRVDIFVDGQRPAEPTFATGKTIRDALDKMSRNVFRARPWFEAGPWGGQWLKKRIPQLSQHEPNYAWSFELITPENGLAFTDGKYLHEISFDWLMYHNYREVLGACSDRFLHEFPIRFDFLDTFDGGNLSLQCHPRPDYIQDHFSEPFTQDETYYIVDCKPEAEVYLGFREDIDPQEFRAELERSVGQSTEIDVKRFVNIEPARPHELFLIPNGTIHCSGANILVLEISATPYIFTFKMYDWMRLGLDGVPRPLNIDRAFANLDFARRGREVSRQLLCNPTIIEQGDDWRLEHLPTHADHFYDVHRYDFESQITVSTCESPHVLMLVEGSSVIVETQNGMSAQYNFAETFVVPAAALSYKLINAGTTPAKVIKAFIKPIP